MERGKNKATDRGMHRQFLEGAQEACNPKGWQPSLGHDWRGYMEIEEVKQRNGKLGLSPSTYMTDEGSPEAYPTPGF